MVVHGDLDSAATRVTTVSEPRSTRLLRIGARRSPLARTQADWIAARLRGAGVETEFVGITTTGDVDRRELTQIGGTGVFAGAVREALLRGEIDVAVHSCKDLPAGPVPGVELAATPVREDPRDVLVGRALDDLGPGSVVGTGSPRREVQLAAWAAARGFALRFVSVRGNVGRRLSLVASGELDATLLAAAGLARLGLSQAGRAERGSVIVPANAPAGAGNALPAQWLDPAVMVPAGGQGALAVEIAADAPDEVRRLVAALDDPATRAEVTAERAFLHALGVGCSAPVGAWSHLQPPVGDTQHLTLGVAAGRTVENTFVDAAHQSGDLVRVEMSGSTINAVHLGESVAAQVATQLRMDPR